MWALKDGQGTENDLDLHHPLLDLGGDEHLTAHWSPKVDESLISLFMQFLLAALYEN